MRPRDAESASLNAQLKAAKAEVTRLEDADWHGNGRG